MENFDTIQDDDKIETESTDGEAETFHNQLLW